eukprot:TRINITY_DN2188_c0_g4_i1.p1 TRINITY_DN2188_c0_g4~~TRINITY_DN2188_c0_g4_i1.p1  ORF type:complete len:386 (-),score=69.60 TRINITY_DN2188_c0_g4_i1:54-1211(-)
MAKIWCGVLGCTGTVGQKFITLLDNHPWFEVRCIGASSRSAGKLYPTAVNWMQDCDVPVYAENMVVNDCSDPQVFIDAGCSFVFSGLDSSVAGEIEDSFANAGLGVFSNSKNHRMDKDVPIVCVDVNPDHLDAIQHQRRRRRRASGNEGSDNNGFIVTNANCSTTGLVIALKPLWDKFKIDKILVTTMQAISGGGIPGVPSYAILDNVVPHISGEEEKLVIEPRKIFGQYLPLAGDGKEEGAEEGGDVFVDATIAVSAHCNRVPVVDGHTECVSISLRDPPSGGGDLAEEVISTFRSFVSPIHHLGLPSAPEYAVRVCGDGRGDSNRPQPRLDRMCGKGYTVSVGRIRECAILDVKFVVLSHNTVIGAAGGALLNAELAKVKGYV